MTALRRTPLFEVHESLGGQIVDFAGWQMPVQYVQHSRPAGVGLVAEHLATRTGCGIFDVSHMGEILVEGPGAEAEVQGLVSNDISSLTDGDACYALLCHENGGTVDDLYVYRLGAERFLLVVNAANVAKDFAHLKAHAREPDRITDRSDAFAQIALQGPKSSAILAAVAPGEAIGLARNFIRVHDFHGANLLVATTGYTGEPGFEIYCPPEVASDLWRACMAVDPVVTPVGLGARDTLRLEMGYALYGHELADDINGYEARVAWAIKLGAGPFVGREALASVKASKPARRLVGLEMVDRGIPRETYPVLHDGAVVGHVTSGTHSPSLKRSVAIALVPRLLSTLGTELSVEIRGQARRARVVKYPFYVHEA